MAEQQIKVTEVPGEFPLAYGENKSQSPAVLERGLSDDPLAMSKFMPAVAGDPSYITIADGDQVIHVLRFLAEAFRRNYGGRVPYIAVAGKHANPCGLAIDWEDPVMAIRKALGGNLKSVMGGELAVNCDVTDELGLEIYRLPPEMCGGEDKKWGLLFRPRP